MLTKLEIVIDEIYSYAVDAMSEQDWNSNIINFNDATINQTWAWCKLNSKETSTLILKRNGKIVAAAMIRIVKVRILKTGLAYVGAGPMWRLKEEEEDIKILQLLIQSLREEYVVKRGYFLRISPNIFTNMLITERLISVYEGANFKRLDLKGQTLFLDVSLTLEELRDNLHRKWRASLNKAEKNNLTVYSGKDKEIFAKFKSVYEEMIDRKRYFNPADINKYENIFNRLPDELKPIVIICEFESKPLAGVIISTIGATAVPWLLASGNNGIECNAAYIVQWQVIKILKQLGINTYDLGGCSPEKNFNTYLFKYRMIGKSPIVYSHIGIMEASDTLTSRIVVRFGETLTKVIQRIKFIVVSK